MVSPYIFADRQEAGNALAQELQKRNYEYPVVLALPRGGVPIAAVVAKQLDAPLDLVLVRKIGTPMQPELAVAAIVDGSEPEIVINEDVRRLTGTTREAIEAGKDKALAEIERRRGLYLANRPSLPIAGKTAIVVDDGIATGASVRAALRALRRRGPKRLVLAVAVAPHDTLETLENEVDDIICLQSPMPFHAVGLYYRDFRQVNDREVIDALASARHALEDRAAMSK